MPKDTRILGALLNGPYPDSYYERKNQEEPVPRIVRGERQEHINGTNPLSVGPFRFGLGGGRRVFRGTSSLS